MDNKDLIKMAKQVKLNRKCAFNALIEKANELRDIIEIAPIKVMATSAPRATIGARTLLMMEGQTISGSPVFSVGIQLGMRRTEQDEWNWHGIRDASIKSELLTQACKMDLIGQLRSRYEDKLKAEYEAPINVEE